MKSGKYILNVRLEEEMKTPLYKIVKKNKSSVNREILIAVDNHIKREKKI